MKRNVAATIVIALTIFTSVACSSPANTPMPPQKAQAQPTQPTFGATTKMPANTPMPPQKAQAQPTPPTFGAMTKTPANTPMPPQKAQAQPTQPTSGAMPSPSGQVTQTPAQLGVFGGPGLAGTVKSVSGNAIQLTTQDGSTVTVQVNDKTTFQKIVTGTLADIQVDSHLFVSGEQSSGITKAQTIQIAPSGEPTRGASPNPGAGQPGPGGAPPAPPGGAQPGLGGTVKSISGDTFQLTGFDGNATTVQVDSKTVIQKFASATLSDVRTGVLITVIADSSNESNTPRIILIGTNAK